MDGPVSRAAVIASTLLLAGCSTPEIATSSGLPEAVFDGVSAAKVEGRIAAWCLKQGLVLSDQSAQQVTCTKLPGPFSSTLEWLNTGNLSTDNVTDNIRFQIVETDDGTRVQAREWVQQKAVFGNDMVTDINSGSQFNVIENALFSMGAHAP